MINKVHEIEFQTAIKMFNEEKDAVTFVQTIVALCARGNEYAKAMFDSIIRSRREGTRSLTVTEKKYMGLK